MTSDNASKQSNPVLSIIVISYNTKEITKNCIQSIYDSISTEKTLQTFPLFEIIVIDNASTDGSQKMLEEIRNPKSEIRNNFEIQIIKNKTNTGFAKANNQGIKIARGKYVLFLNSDIVVQKNAVQSLFDYYKEHESGIHFLGGKLMNKDLSPQPSCGPFYTLPVVFGALFLKGDYWGLTRYSPNKTSEVDWISGACILTKKEYMEKLGGFDEKIFMYMDEIDLLYRAKKQGYKVFFYPEAQFIHLGSASSTGKTYPILQVYRGFLYFYRKHYPKTALFFLKFLLQLKAVVSVIIGRIVQNRYLVKTYEEANKIAQMG